MHKYYYTDKQLLVATWLHELGFRTELEVPIDQYCMDIYIPEIDTCVEVDGIGHYPKKDKKRDRYLRTKGISTFRTPSDVSEIIFKEKFNLYIKEYNEKSGT